MKKLCSILLILLVNHTLIQSAVAGAHVALDHQERFESPHLHIDGPHIDHQDHTNDQSQQKHHQNSHIHFHYDLTQGASVALGTTHSVVQAPVLLRSQYLGLSHRPALPPPTC